MSRIKIDRMTNAIHVSATSLVPAIARDGYAFVHAGTMRELLAGFGELADWDSFAASWNQLELDTYMADGGRYRRRRHAVFAAQRRGAIARQAHQPHYQTLDYNPLHGGIARWFEPIADEVGERRDPRGPCSPSAVSCSKRSRPRRAAWHIEVHQFRIEARAGEAGRPTPEGLHRDGVDYVLVLLVNRRNIASGTTSIHALDGRALGQFTLTEPLDAALVDDARVAHGVTPVEAHRPDAACLS